MSVYPTKDFENEGFGPIETLDLKIFKIEEKDIDEEDEEDVSTHLELHLYCHDKNSKMHLCRIANYHVTACVKLPKYTYVLDEANSVGKDKVYEVSEEIDWDEELAEKLFYAIKRRMKDKGPISFQFEMRKEIYYFSNNKYHPYIYLKFSFLRDKDAFKRMCNYKFGLKLYKDYEFIDLEVHEEKVSTSLRMLCERQIDYSDIFTCKGRKVDYDSQYSIAVKCVNEYFIDYSTIKKSKAKFFVFPRFFCYDFETFSSKGKKRFPSANQLHDAIFLISIDFMVLEKPETRRKYCLCLGKCKPIEGAQVICFDREQDLLIAFMNLRRYLDPDIIMGYNIYGFDEPYLLGRFDIHYIPKENIPNSGRLRHVRNTSIKETNWSSSGYGSNDITFVADNGRITQDLLPTIKRLYKLRQYNLDFVANMFIKKEKIKVSLDDLYGAYEAYLNGDEDAEEKMTKIAEYCIRDSAITLDLYINRSIYYHISSLSAAGRISMIDVLLRGEQCRCYAQLYNECFRNKYIISNGKTFDYYYSGGYVGKPIRGVHRYVFTLDFNSLYPSIMRAYNLCYTTYIPVIMWPDIPIEYCEVMKFYQMENESHFSMSRKMDIKDKLKIKKRGYNVEITEEEKEYYSQGEHKFRKQKMSISGEMLPGYEYENDSDADDTPETEAKENEEKEDNEEDAEEEKEEKPKKKKSKKDEKKVKRYYEFRFIKKEYFEGFLPRLETLWVNSRNDVKKRIKINEAKLKETNNYLEILQKQDLNLYNEARINSIKEEIKTLTKKLEEDTNRLDYLEIQNEIRQKEERCKDISEELKDETDEKKIEFLKSEYEMYFRQADQLNRNLTVDDKTQNAIKIVANSGYGFTGTATGMLPGLFIAICVTTEGQRLVQKANDELVEEFKQYGAKVVYNDTDSSMISLEIDQTYNIDKIGMEMQTFICGQKEIRDKDGNIIQEEKKPIFKDPLKMEFEDCSQMCAIKPKFYIKLIRNTKKEDIDKYGPWKLNKDGTNAIKNKGILTARRGNSVFSMTVYQEAADMIIYKRPVNEVLMNLSSHIKKLLRDGFSAKQLSKITELGSDYKQEGYYMNVFSKNLIKWGKPVRPGDRIEYIVVRTEQEDQGYKVNMGEKCRELEMWEQDENHEPLDYVYYSSRGLRTQYDDLFDVGYHDIITRPELEDIGYQMKPPKRKFHHFSKPVAMIEGIISDFMRMDKSKFKRELNEYGLKYKKEKGRYYYISKIIEAELKEICRRIDEL